MKRAMCTSLFLSLFALGILATPDAQAQNLIRKSAEFLYFGTTAPPAEAATTAAASATAAGGLTVYTKSVSTGIGESELYVTVSAAGDTHGGAGLLISCLVDGTACNAGDSGGSATPAGWIRIQKMPKPTTSTNCNDGGGGTGDCHDNPVNYTWCMALPPPAF